MTLNPRLERPLEELQANGFCIVEDVLPAKKLAALRDALYAVARFEQEAGWNRGYAYDRGENRNQRIWNLISRNPVFCQLVEHELALEMVRAVIGWPALLSGSSANLANRHGEEEVLHADQGYMPQPWARAHGVNIAWAIDDFTAENGATRVVPGSHLLNRSPQPGEEIAEFRAVEAPAGAMIVIEGRCWHRTGRNLTDRPRAGVFNWYTLPIYMPQENWFVSLNPAIRQFGSETLQTLLGFRPTILGRVNGQESLVPPREGSA